MNKGLKKKLLDKIFPLLFQLLIFLFPTQLALHFWPAWSHVFGIRVDFLSPAIYLSDILVVIILAVGFKKYPLLINFKLLFLLFLFSLFNIFMAQEKMLAAFRWVKIFELILFVLLIIKTNKILTEKLIMFPLCLSIILVSLLGLYQFVFGHTLGGVAYFLGERSFNILTPGISLVSFLGNLHLRPYSIFSHPNSLAGYMAVVLPLLLKWKTSKCREKVLKIGGLIFLLLTIVLTFSNGAFLSLVIAGLFVLIAFFKKPFFKSLVLFYLLLITTLSLLMPLLADEILFRSWNIGAGIKERLVLASVAGKVISQNPIQGLGLNNFIYAVPKTQTAMGVSWLLQPVHNISLLVFSELGIVGLLLFAHLIFKTLIRAFEKDKALVFSIIIILTTGFADHYWLTLQQNLLLFCLIVGLSFRKKLIRTNSSFQKQKNNLD